MTAEPGTAQQFKHAVTDVGKTQIGDGIDLPFLHMHLEIIFHQNFNLSVRSWAQNPVNAPVKIPMRIITGRYAARPGVKVTPMATAI